MFPADFDYVRAGSLAEALSLLATAAAADEDAKLLAGGQSLLPMMKLRLATPRTLIDIGGIAELAGVTATAEGTAIKALTTYRALQRDPRIGAAFPALTDALAVLADQQVRARGTIGGCVAHGDPAADLPAVLLALGARVTVTSPTGARTVPLDGFLRGVFATDLAADEALTAITLPPAPAGQAYEKFEQPASHLPLAGVCAVVAITDGVITSAGVAVTGVSGRAFRALDTERSLAFSPPTAAVIEAAASSVATGVRPLSDQHASGPFRLHLAEMLARRALTRAVERAEAASKRRPLPSTPLASTAFPSTPPASTPSARTPLASAPLASAPPARPRDNSKMLIGQAIVRREDPALLTGHGVYLDDVTPPGTLHAFVVRSPVAHARIVGVDVAAAREAPGVVAVYTAADLAGVGPLPGAEGLPPDAANPAYPVLAAAKVLWAGQPVALVVADTPELAADAAELVVVEYDELPAVTGPVEAAAPDAPPLHEGMIGNVAFTKRLTSGDAAAAFAAAAYRVGQRMVSQRLAPVALEPRGVLACPAADGRLEVRLSTQRPHGARNLLARILGMPLERLRVVVGDMGGGFGAKGPLYPDQVAVIAAARALSRPVKWVEERSESFLATTHGRDQVADLEMAADADGRITAIRGRVHASFGAYFTPNAPNSLLARLGPMLPQGYLIENFDVELTGVFANTTPVGPYRGAGRPEAAYFCERLVDLLARQTGLDPADVRRRNFVPAAAFPYTSCTGLVYDSGDYQAGLELLLEKVDYKNFAARRSLAAAGGQLLGIGLASFVEPGGVTPRVPGPGGIVGDTATVTVSPTGAVTVAVGTSAHGQGHETAFAQLAADLLGVAYEDVTVVFGDTDTTPFGYGTFGSRTAVAGGTAVFNACQAALEAARRVDAPMSLARAAARLGGITVTASSGAPPETYASGSYACVVSVDPDTGRVRLLRVVAVDDCGVVINPLLVEGQVHGAVAQGVGQALYEHVQYDSAGQPMSASLMDYAVPSAASLPSVESYSVCTPSPINPLGVKGMGESGTIGVTPAVVNAVMDALRPHGIRHLDMPLTPEKIRTALHPPRP